MHGPVLKGSGKMNRRWSFILGIKFIQISKVNNYNVSEFILINSSRNVPTFKCLFYHLLEFLSNFKITEVSFATNTDDWQNIL